MADNYQHSFSLLKFIKLYTFLMSQSQGQGITLRFLVLLDLKLMFYSKEKQVYTIADRIVFGRRAIGLYIDNYDRSWLFRH